MKESVPGFPSIYPFSRGKIQKNQHGTKVNQEYERVGSWISLFISFLKRKNSEKPATWYKVNQEYERFASWISLYMSSFHEEKPNKAKRIQRQCGKVL
jgi:hypothetical protein